MNKVVSSSPNDFSGSRIEFVDTKETVIACWPLYISIYAFLTYTTETPINCKKKLLNAEIE